MAREHARFFLSAWDDGDWTALDVPAQHAYWTLLTSRHLSWCGVLDYVPGRLKGLARGLTPAKLNAAVRTLEASRFVIVDDETSELLVRSYVRHDNVMVRKNMGMAVAYAWGDIASHPLRAAVLHELARLYDRSPTLPGWHGFERVEPDAHKEVLLLQSAIAMGHNNAPLQSGITSPDSNKRSNGGSQW